MCTSHCDPVTAVLIAKDDAPRLLYLRDDFSKSGDKRPLAFVLDGEFTSPSVLSFFRHHVFAAGVRLDSGPWLPGSREGAKKAKSTTDDDLVGAEERAARRARRNEEREKKQEKAVDSDVERERQRRLQMEEEAMAWFADEESAGSEEVEDVEESEEAVEVDAE